MTRVVKLSISLPRELLSVADQIAQEQGTSRSKVISACLEEVAERRRIAQLEEAYREMACENRLLAEQLLPAVLESWPGWDDDNGTTR